MYSTMVMLSPNIYFLAVLIFHGVFLVSSGKDNIETSCAGTPYPDFCRSALSTAPENETGNPRDIAYWAIEAAYRIGNEACNRASSLYQLDELQGGDQSCMADCYQVLKKPIDSLWDACEKYPDYDAMITDVRSCLAMAKKNHVEWNCERCRKGESKKMVDAVSKGNDLGKIMAILSALLDK